MCSFFLGLRAGLQGVHVQRGPSVLCSLSNFALWIFFYENFSCKIDTEVAGSDPAHIKHGKPMAAVSNVEAFENLCLAGQLCLPFHGATAGP